jgi:AraC-like DNA-binding protein
MYVVQRPTDPALLPFVKAFWYFAGPPMHPRERVLPTGAMQLLVNLHEDELRSSGADGCGVRRVAGAALQGVLLGPVVIDTAQQRTIVGVGFRAGGAFPFFAGPASETSGELVGLDTLWGRDGAALRDRLLSALPRSAPPGPAGALAVLRELEAALLARVAHPLVPDPALAFAVAALERGAAVSAVAERLGITGKRLGHRFGERIGLPPKRFARVRRFQRVLGSITPGVPVDWARIAAERGFCDQAHLIHDFRSLSGLSPSQYRPRSPADRNHVPLPG